MVSREQDARQQLERVIEAEPSNGHAWHSLGMLEEQQGRLQEALDCFKRGQQSDGAPSQLSTFPLCSSVLYKHWSWRLPDGYKQQQKMCSTLKPCFLYGHFVQQKKWRHLDSAVNLLLHASGRVSQFISAIPGS